VTDFVADLVTERVTVFFGDVVTVFFGDVVTVFFGDVVTVFFVDTVFFSVFADIDLLVLEVGDLLLAGADLGRLPVVLIGPIVNKCDERRGRYQMGTFFYKL
jgi:hypothetical protein